MKTIFAILAFVMSSNFAFAAPNECGFSDWNLINRAVRTKNIETDSPFTLELLKDLLREEATPRCRVYKESLDDLNPGFSVGRDDLIFTINVEQTEGGRVKRVWIMRN